MNATQTTKTATARTIDLATRIAAVIAAGEMIPANDNAGLSARIAEMAPDLDDARLGCEILVPRVTEQVAEALAPMVGDILWSAEARRQSRSRRACVLVWPQDALCRAVKRRVRAMLEFARAAGFEAFLWGW